MEVLQCAFWRLDPARTVAKFEAFAGLEGEEARTFVMLEDWANDGPPVSEAAAREMFETLFAADATGSGRRGGRRAVDRPGGARHPLAQHRLDHRPDRARTPPRSRAGERLDLALGHVGMVVGRRARRGAVGAARGVAFPHCSKVLEAAAES